jgi:hypothetical protein
MPGMDAFTGVLNREGLGENLLNEGWIEYAI